MTAPDHPILFIPGPVEVPLELRYDRRGADSKMKVLRTIRQTLLLIFRRRLGIH